MITKVVLGESEPRTTLVIISPAGVQTCPISGIVGNGVAFSAC